VKKKVLSSHFLKKMTLVALGRLRTALVRVEAPTVSEQGASCNIEQSFSAVIHREQVRAVRMVHEAVA
jgi:hypothetical protein